MRNDQTCLACSNSFPPLPLTHCMAAAAPHVALSTQAPTWLKKSFNKGRISSVINTLEDREELRREARYASLAIARSNRVYGVNSNAAALLGSLSPIEQFYSVAVGCSPENSRCNRYSNVEPYDRTRVVVYGGGSIPRGGQGPEASARYLNANWVRERFGGKWWIASQAPLPSTSHAFLSLLLQSQTRPPGAETEAYPTTRIRTVVQLTPYEERGRVAADRYFPERVGESILVGQPPPKGAAADPRDYAPLQVSLVASQSVEDAKCIWSTVSVRPAPHPTSGAAQDAFQPITFQHLLYTRWPDHGVPTAHDRASLRAFMLLVDRANRDLLPFTSPSTPAQSLHPDPPIIVNCSAGIGRTGTFIALASIARSLGHLPGLISSSQLPSAPMPESPLGPLPEELSDDCVLVEIDSLRDQRPGMVQQTVQILLVYESLRDLCAVSRPVS